MNVPVTLRRLWIQLTADRRRFGIFCTMLGVGLLLWARLIVVTNTPRTVVADDPAAQSAQSAQALPGESLSQSDPTKTHESPRTPVRVVLSTAPRRDPFIISQEHFPRRFDDTLEHQDAGKFAPKPAEESEQARFARIRELAEGLKLEAILSPGGGQPLVVINGRTYRLNDEVPARPGGSRGGARSQSGGEAAVRFRVVQVAERSAVLEHDGFRFQRSLASLAIGDE